VGELAAAHHIVLHELVAQAPSLEEAYMEQTHESVDYRADESDHYLTLARGA
jgi:ABC-2 type transport system ATP-binding protein